MSNNNLSIKPLDKRNGMLNLTANMLFRFDDIQDACIKLGYDNHKMLDELSGFPNGKDKCVGILCTGDTDDTQG